MEQAQELSERRACELLRVARSSQRYRSRKKLQDEPVRAALEQAAREKPRFGYRRLQIELRKRGWTMNHKRVWRLYREAGLSLRRKRRKRLTRSGWRAPVIARPNQQWSIDFVHDGCGDQRVFRALTVVDNFTRECLAIEVDSCLSSVRVTRVLERIIVERGAPESIRSDNGPEFTSRHYLAWCEQRQIRADHIDPGRPMQNGTVESFNGRLRDECLNANWFWDLRDARLKIEAWRVDYNQQRPHSSLDYQTPAAFAAAQLPSGLATLGLREAEPPCPGPPISEPGVTLNEPVKSYLSLDQ